MYEILHCVVIELASNIETVVIDMMGDLFYTMRWELAGS